MDVAVATLRTVQIEARLDGLVRVDERGGWGVTASVNASNDGRVACEVDEDAVDADEA